jgi:hypothetical protein
MKKFEDLEARREIYPSSKISGTSDLISAESGEGSLI